MTTTQRVQNQEQQLGELAQQLADRLAPRLIANPELATQIVDRIDTLFDAAIQENENLPRPADGGLANLVGIGDESAQHVGDTRLPYQVRPYDNSFRVERGLAVADLYYIYQHEMIGIFGSILKLQELFKAGTVRLSNGDGAYRLYQFDRRDVLRHTLRDRMQAYRRVFGYTNVDPMRGAKPNTRFHGFLSHFMSEVSNFWRDKRVAEVVRQRANDPSFANIARVRRSGLNFRNNLKDASYGHIFVLRVEVLQLLDEAFGILASDDIRDLFGADNAWDASREIQRRYLGRIYPQESERSRMAISGRAVINWLSQDHILTNGRPEFEALLALISDDADEWIMSHQALNVEQPTLIRGRGVRPVQRAREASPELQGEWSG